MSGAAVSEYVRGSKIVLIGKSNCSLNPDLVAKLEQGEEIKGDFFIKREEYNVTTQLIFVKTKINSEYHLSAVKIDDETLNPSCVEYWRDDILSWNNR